MSNLRFLKLDATGSQTREQILARIAQLDVVIDELLNVALSHVQTGSIAEYELDDGQSKQIVKYKSPSSVTSSIEYYMRIRGLLERKLQSSMTRLVPSQNFGG